MKEFIEFISMITEKPGMFAVNRVEDISHIIFGYKSGASQNAGTAINNFIYGFRVFVNKDYDSKENFSWEKLIRLYSGSDSHSIELFKQTFQKYIESLGENN